MTKKLMMMAVVAAAAASGAWADTETVGGYTWTYRINRTRRRFWYNIQQRR